MLEFLEAEFLPEEHQHEQGGHLFIGIEYTIKRLNDFQKQFNTDWHFDIKETKVEDTGKQTGTKKPIYRATIVGSLTMGDYKCGLGTRDGTGSMESYDVDTAIKSAQAFALRKAGNLFGIALYIWDDYSRTTMEQQMLDQGEATLLKDRLGETAELNGVVFTEDPKVNAQLVAEKFGVSVKDLQDINVLRRLVEANCE